MIAKETEKENEVAHRRLAYEKCKDGCQCDGDTCAAAGLYWCRFCNTYKKRVCGVAKCKEAYEKEGCTDVPLPQKKRKSGVKRPRDLELAVGSDDEDPDSEFAIGDTVRVYFDGEGDWFVGQVDLVKKDGRVRVYFQDDDSDALIDPDITGIEKYNPEQLEAPPDVEEGAIEIFI